MAALVPQNSLALSIMYPGEGLKTVVSAGGELVTRALTADNPVSRGAKGAVDSVEGWAGRLDKLDVDMTASLYHNTVSGDATRSFLKTGLQTQETLAIAAKKRYSFMRGGEFEFHSAVRNTDDRQVDNEKRQRLQGLYGVFRRTDDYELRLGNVSGSFSPYSLSSSADVGVQGMKALGSKARPGELQLYYGRPTQAIGAKSFDRHVYGARLAALKGSLGAFVDKLGFNYVRTRDDLGSVEASQRPANAVDNEVVAWDLGLKGKAASLQSELAYSRTDPNTRTTADSSVHGFAAKLSGAARAPNGLGFEGTSLASSYERVDPNYRSTSGGGSADGDRIGGSANTTAALPGKLPRVALAYGANTSHNNIQHQLARTNTSTVHNVNLTVKPLEKLADGDGFRASLAKNLSLGAAYAHTVNDTSDASSASTIRGQSYQLATSAGRHSFSTFLSHQTTEERTGATGDRRNTGVGATYGCRELGWGIPAAKPFMTDLSLTAQQVRDRTLDAAGGSLQRSMRVGAQTKVNDDERLDLDYELAFNGNDAANSDFRQENFKAAYIVSRFIKTDGSLSLSYNSKRVMEAVSAKSYREQVVRGDLALKWGGAAAEKPAAPPMTQEEARAAVAAVLEPFSREDAGAFLAMLSPGFKGDRAKFEADVRKAFADFSAVKFELVSVTGFVPDRGVMEVSFTWQRRRRVFATGAEEMKAGAALFRLERSGEKWLLQEIRKDNPLF